MSPRPRRSQDVVLSGDARRHRRTGRHGHQRRHRRRPLGREQGHHLPALGITRAAHPRRDLLVAAHDGRARHRLTARRPRRAPHCTSWSTSTPRRSREVFPSFLDAAVRDPELAELRQETLRMGRASFERVVRMGIARGELPRRRRRAPRRRPRACSDHLPARGGPDTRAVVRRGSDRRCRARRIRHRASDNDSLDG